MFKGRAFKDLFIHLSNSSIKLGGIFHKFGCDYIHKNQEKETHNIYNDKINSFDNEYNNYPIGTDFNEQLSKLAHHYIKAKNSLENKLFNPEKLTFAEKILINRSRVSFLGGYYEDYIFKSYDDGKVFVLGPKNILINGPNQSIISKDPNIVPLKHTTLKNVYHFIDIKCIHTQTCLRDLAMESEYFSKFKSHEDRYFLEAELSRLADTLQKTS